MRRVRACALGYVKQFQGYARAPRAKNMRLRIGRYRIRADGGHLVFATALAAFIAWYGYSTYQASRATADLLLILPGTFFMLLLYCLLLLQEVRIEAADIEEPLRPVRDAKERTLLVKQWAYVAAMAGFLFLLPVAGLEIAAFLFTAGMLWLLGSRKILFNLGLSAAFSLAISYIFVEAIGVPIDSLFR